jgi:hypothetical protein
MAKESENIQPGNADLERKGVKHTNVQIYLSGASSQERMFLETSHTQPILACSMQIFVQNSN